MCFTNRLGLALAIALALPVQDADPGQGSVVPSGVGSDDVRACPAAPEGFSDARPGIAHVRV